MSGTEACIDGNWLVSYSGDEMSTTIEGYWTDDCRVAVSSNGEWDDFGINDCVPWEDTFYPTVIRADELHDQGIDGSGIGIAVVDTGISGAFWDPDNYPSYGAVEVVHSYDAYNGIDNQGADGSGHGSHVTTIATSSGQAPNGKYNGVAPGAHIINVKAFDNYGQGSYDDVIASSGSWTTRAPTTSRS
jgi:subtilisin family serine protease